MVIVITGEGISTRYLQCTYMYVHCILDTFAQVDREATCVFGGARMRYNIGNGQAMETSHALDQWFHVGNETYVRSVLSLTYICSTSVYTMLDRRQ